MKHHLLAIIFLFHFLPTAFPQNYTSYFTGNPTDISTVTKGGICLMGGATEDDNAMKWFLEQANGGDILVLRASGSDGYNDYLYTDLGVGVNSVETIVCHHSVAANEVYVHQKIQQAEAIWFAGGDQWDYISYWRNSPIDSLINEALASRNLVIGGTSAGMAIQGGFYFSAKNGTVTSSTALSNPFDSNITVGNSPFISNSFLADVITDTHYDNPDRQGRHVVFLARISVDYGIAAKGIACDEYTAICIDSTGMARVYGNHPSYDDNAYFIQSNCELTDVLPENCSQSQPLDWNRGNAALKVYTVKGTPNGANAFNLKDWKTGTGGMWENWFVDQGILRQQSSTQPNCNALSINESQQLPRLRVYPNPTSNHVTVQFDAMASFVKSCAVLNSLGQVEQKTASRGEGKISIELKDFPTGLYFIELTFIDDRKRIQKLVIR